MFVNSKLILIMKLITRTKFQKTNNIQLRIVKDKIKQYPFHNEYLNFLLKVYLTSDFYFLEFIFEPCASLVIM